MLQIYKTLNDNGKKNYISINGFGRPFSINFHNQHYYITDMDLNTVFKISMDLKQYSFIYENHGWSQNIYFSEKKIRREKKNKKKTNAV